jgi:two-component system, OmpR family, sensor histidine kinase CiaH
MFRSARIKLTGWYLLIIMTISILFSLGIYSQINNEFNRVERIQIRRESVLHLLQAPPPPPEFNENFIKESRDRLTLILIFINLGIFVLAGGAGYFLSGKTLKPIQKMVEDQNQFISDASHELRTPLTSLRTELEVNLRDKNLSLKETKSLLKSNLEDVIKLQTLSNDLMELSILRNINNLAIINAGEAVENAIQKIKPLANEKNISIKNNIRKLNIVGNKDRLTELLIILLDNAIKYSNKHKLITLTAQTNNNKTIIKVIDQGIGMEKKEMANIFKRFYRVEKSRSKNENTGYGLGLSIAEKIVSAHNGKIEVESVLGKGSTFSIILEKA